jgi:glycosyltransferase involved in cell wall biosynthesis
MAWIFLLQILGGLIRMKVSFICTVLNEAKSIKAFLDSIEAQTKKPDEVIIVDAGSKDKTISIIKKYPRVRLIIKKGLNRSQGRNLAIKKAKYQVIVVSDAGCTLESNWLKTITEPLPSPKVEAVAGFYHVKTDNIFQKSLAPFVATMPDQFNTDKFLPSSRSLAFKLKAFEQAGRYPENLDYCEDLVFAQALKNKTNLVVKPNAIVYWQMVNNLKEYFNQIKNYAFGDMQAKYLPHLKKHLLVYIKILLFISFPILFIFYPLWPIFKHYQYIKHPLAFIYLPIIQLTTDLGIIMGSLYGLLKKRR